MALCRNYLGCAPDHLRKYAQDQRLVYNQCQDCGIIWRDEASFDLEQPYDQHYFDSKNYQKNRAHKVAKSGWLLDLARHFNPQISRLLEIGCSLGNTLEAAKKRNLWHLGIDVSEFAVEYCRQHQLNASNESLPELIQQQQQYDLILMQHVLEHFKDPFEVLSQCHQLLTAKGMVLILIPNADYGRAKRLRERHKFYSRAGVGIEHYVYFNYQNLPLALQACGFKVITKNYPLKLLKYDSFTFLCNRWGRRFLSLMGADQELVVLAQKI